METRKHSSRMRTAHLLTASHSIPGPMYGGGGGVNAHLPDIPTPWTYPPPLDIPTPKGHGARDKWERTWDQRYPPSRKNGLKIPTPIPLSTDRHLWKHYLPASSLAGGNKQKRNRLEIRRKQEVAQSKDRNQPDRRRNRSRIYWFLLLNIPE